MEYFTLKDVSKILDVPYYRIEYLIRSGKIPEIPKSSSGNRVFKISDIESIKKVISEGTKFKSET